MVRERDGLGTRATSGISMARTTSAETNGTNPKLSRREAKM